MIFLETGTRNWMEQTLSLQHIFLYYYPGERLGPYSSISSKSLSEVNVLGAIGATPNYSAYIHMHT